MLIQILNCIMKLVIIDNDNNDNNDNNDDSTDNGYNQSFNDNNLLRELPIYSRNPGDARVNVGSGRMFASSETAANSGIAEIRVYYIPQRKSPL